MVEIAERDSQVGAGCMRQENKGAAPYIMGLPFQEVPPREGQTRGTGSLTKHQLLAKSERQKKLTPEQTLCQERGEANCLSVGST